MNPQQPQTNPKLCAAIAILTMLAGVMMVPPAWWPILFPPQARPPVNQNSPLPVASPTASPTVALRKQNVCGMWFSTTSRKQYNFVCQGQDSFEIYEISNQLLNNNGSGKLTEDGNIEADLFSPLKNRTAHLKLRLSADGRTLEGSWQGDDPRESGQLKFHRI